MIKKIRQCFFIGFVGMMTLMIAGKVLFPEKFQNIMPYRFYNVLTNSMEPTIGVNDLVLIKTYRSGMSIKKNDIITFHAKRFGEPVIITHRFSHMETNEEGVKVYKTHSEQSKTFDPYETKEEDIIGVYVIHLPYLGKFVLFLKSGFGLLWICEIIVIFMIKATIKTRWEEKEYQLSIE